MKKSVRPNRLSDASQVHRHPDADRPTRRIPFTQLRALVMSLIDAAEAAAEEEQGDVSDNEPTASRRAPDRADTVQEFDTQPTTFLRRPRGSSPGTPMQQLGRAGTMEALDALIAELRSAYARQMTGAAPRRIPRRRSEPGQDIREVNPPRPSSNRR